MATRKAYAWKDPDTDKWCLSVIKKGDTHSPGGKRPYNQHDTQGALVTEAAKRGLQVEWENDGK